MGFYKRFTASETHPWLAFGGQYLLNRCFMFIIFRLKILSINNCFGLRTRSDTLENWLQRRLLVDTIAFRNNILHKIKEQLSTIRKSVRFFLALLSYVCVSLTVSIGKRAHWNLYNAFFSFTNNENSLSLSFWHFLRHVLCFVPDKCRDAVRSEHYGEVILILWFSVIF